MNATAGTAGPNGAGPLAGLLVVELGQYIAGPYAGKLLGDLGARVIKVEAPQGDPMRRWEGEDDRAYSPQFGAYNRNKEGVVLDLKSSGGLAALLRLAAAADVLIENFRPGVADRLGFGPDVLRETNPGLVYCSITGFGADGPYAGRPSYDTVISATGGMYSQLVPPDAPRPVGPAFSDLLSGMSAVQGILAALHARGQNGHGQRVEVSMVGALLDFLTESASTYLDNGSISGPDSRPRRAQAYACVAADDRAFVVHLSVPEKFWIALLEVLERPDLADDERFRSRDLRVRNYDQLDAVIKAEARRLPRALWFERLAARDIPHGPLNTIEELFGDPQIAQLGLVTDVPAADGATVRMPRHSTTFSASGRPDYRLAPELGADTTQVLAEAGTATGDDGSGVRRHERRYAG